MSVWTLPVFADELSDAKNKKEKISNDINNIAAQKQTVKKQQTQLTQKGKILESAQKEEDKKYQELKQQIESILSDINGIEDTIEDTERKYNQQTELFKKRLRIMYENSSGNSLFGMLTESKNITDFFNRLELISAISKNDKELIKSLASMKQDVEYKKTLKEDEKQQKLLLAYDKQKRIEDLKLSRASLQDEMSRLDTTLKKLEAQEDELLKQSSDIEKQIKALQKKNRKYAGGIMAWPSTSSYEITSYFGMRMHPVLRKTKMHTGIDIGAARGSSILAANKGTVIYAGWQSGYGQTVIIDHGGGISTLYAHCSKLLVSAGQEVSTGDVIAKVGSTGLATGPHLHFEVRVDGSPVDPLKYVGGK